MTVEVEERLKNVEHLGHLCEDECTMWPGLQPPQQHVQCLQLPYVAAYVKFTSTQTSCYRYRQILPHPLTSDQTILHGSLWSHEVCDRTFTLSLFRLLPKDKNIIFVWMAVSTSKDTFSGREVFVRLASRWNSLMMMIIIICVLWKWMHYCCCCCRYILHQ